VGDIPCPPVVCLAFVCVGFAPSATGVAGVVLPPSIDRISACAMSALEAGRYSAFALTVCGSSVPGRAAPGSPYALPESPAPSSTLIRLRKPFALSAPLAGVVEREGGAGKPALRVGSLRFGAAAASAFTPQINAVGCPTRRNRWFNDLQEQFQANLGRGPKRHTSASPTLALLILIGMISITFIKRRHNCFVVAVNSSKSGRIQIRAFITCIKSREVIRTGN
jgi:hypothetical protein